MVSKSLRALVPEFSHGIRASYVVPFLEYSPKHLVSSFLEVSAYFPDKLSEIISHLSPYLDSLYSLHLHFLCSKFLPSKFYTR